MKKIFLALILCMPFAAISQTVPTPTTWDKSTQTEEYVLILATEKFLSNKVTIALDYGQAQKLTSDRRLKDESGKPLVFNSVIDALNYMNSQGWIFIDAYVITVSNQNVYHYLMRKPVVK